MHRLLMAGLAAGALLFGGVSAFAEDHVVKVVQVVDQPTLDGSGKKDKFDTTVSDGSAVTKTELWCTAAKSGFLGLGAKDEECEIRKGSGSVLVDGSPPAKAYTVAGKFTFQAAYDGEADLSGVEVKYLARKGVTKADPANWAGSIKFMPERPPQSAKQLFDKALAKAKAVADAGDLSAIADAGEEYDSVSFDEVAIPVTGVAGEVACVWSGDMVYPYATEVWAVELVAECNGESYELAGDISWEDVDASHATYTVTLLAPDAVSGVTGALNMELNNKVPVKISETRTDQVAKNIKVDGELTGSGVPREVTHSLGDLLATVSRAFHGA